MKRSLLVLSVCVVAFFATAATAFASSTTATSSRLPVSHDYIVLKSLLKWKNLGGDPLVNGGFPTKASFADGLVNNKRVSDALRLVVRLDGYPSRITELAKAEAAAGHIYTGKLDRSIGWMSYGNPNGKIKVQRAVWVGAGKPATWYVKAQWDLSKPVMKDGQQQIKTVRYKVIAPKKCGNIHVRPLPPKYRPVTPPETPKHKVLVRKVNFDTNALIAGWGITAVLDGQSVTAATGADWVAIGEIAEGRSYSVTEETRTGWIPKSPTTVSGTMGSADVQITFTNQQAAPEIPKHKILVRKVNFDTGALISGWGITAVLDGQSVSATTGADWVAIGEVAEGRSYSVTEETRANWIPKSPTTVTGTMGSADVQITFKNQYCPPEVPKHKIFVRKVNFDTHKLISGWGITAVLDGQSVTATTGCDWVAIGELAEGKSYTVTEETRKDWIPKSPTTVSGTMKDCDVYITFKNQYCPKKHDHELRVCVVTDITKCGKSYYEATLKASVSKHSDKDALSYKWTVDGKAAGSERCVTVQLSYGDKHIVVVEVTDAAGNCATATTSVCVDKPDKH